MKKIIELVESRIEIGKRPYDQKATEAHRNLLDLHECDHRIVQEVLRMYKDGELQ